MTVNEVDSDSQQIVVNNIAFQFKLKSCRVLFDLMSVLKSSFEPYVDRSLAALVQVLLYPYSAEIRKISRKAAVGTLDCVG